MSFLEESDPLWIYLAEVLREQGLRVFDVQLRNRTALEINVMPLELTPERRSASIDECTKLCKQLRILLFAEGERFELNGEALEIEVSTPGVNRNLRTKLQFQEAVGERVKLFIDDLNNDQRQPQQRVMIGKLKASTDDFLELIEEPVTGAKKEKGKRQGGKRPEVTDDLPAQRIPFERVRKANVEYDFSSH